MLSHQLFDKSTERLVKIRDTFDNTFIFKLDRNQDPSYQKAMADGTLVAYGFKSNDKSNPTPFRVPHTAELLEDRMAFQTIPAQLVTDKIEVFLSKIGKIMDAPEDADHLKAAIRGVEKLAGLEVAAVTAPAKVVKAAAKKLAPAPAPAPAPALAPAPVVKPVRAKAKPVAVAADTLAGPIVPTWLGKPLVQRKNQFFSISETRCVKCGQPVELSALAWIKDGVVKGLYTKRSANAHKIGKSRTLWEHDSCDEVKAALLLEEQKHEGQHDKGAAEPPAVEETVAVHMLTLLNDSAKSADYKLGYLTSFFDIESRKNK